MHVARRKKWTEWLDMGKIIGVYIHTLTACLTRLKKCYETRNEPFPADNQLKGTEWKWRQQQCCIEYDKDAYNALYGNSRNAKTSENAETSKDDLLQISTTVIRICGKVY